MFKFGISGRSIAISVVAIVNILFIAGCGWWGMHMLDLAVGQTAEVGKVLSNQQYADMMHDALRSDVLYARQSASQGETTKATEIYADIQQHGETLLSRMNENAAINVSPTVLKAIADIKPVVEAYRQEALKTAKAAFEQPDLYAAQYTSFQANFSNLEGGMEALSGEIEKYQAEVVAAGDSLKSLALTLLVGSTVLALLVSVFSAWLTRTTIVKPLAAIEGLMGEISRGNFKAEILFTDRHDEIGAMARALNVFKKNGLDMQALSEQQRETTERGREERKQARYRMAEDLETQVGAIAAAVAQSSVEVENFAKSMTESAQSTTMEAVTVANALDAASQNVQAAASAGEELSASIQEISRQVNRSADLATATVEDARKTDETVQDLAQASKKIGEVVSLISDIAAQTNLLALNATIEAARAGEAGKGFAVVASEVKNLANQTAHATAEISKQIVSSQTVTDSAIAAIRKISERISEMDHIATAIRGAMSQQEEATKEISHSMSAAATGTAQVNHALGNVSKVASETGSVATQLSMSSVTLSKQSDSLRTSVEKFANSVRANG